MTLTGRANPLAWTILGAVVAVIATLALTQPWNAQASPGESDATFVPTAGCRLTDTRPAPLNVGPRAAPLGAGDVLEVTVHGANGRCTGDLAIPDDAVGVALNATAVGATAASNLRIYPANLTDVPLLSNLNVVAGGPPTPNKVDVQLSPDGKLRVFNFRGSVDVILDVTGYYTAASLLTLADQVGTPGPQGPTGPTGPQGDPGPPGASSPALFGIVTEFGDLVAGSGVTDATKLGTGVYRITFDRRVVDTCAISLTHFDLFDLPAILTYSNAVSLDGASIIVEGWRASNLQLVDTDFDVVATCPPS